MQNEKTVITAKEKESAIDQGFVQLAYSIMDAYKPYSKALKTVNSFPEECRNRTFAKKNRILRDALREKKEIEDFYRSDWFDTLTTVAPLLRGQGENCLRTIEERSMKEIGLNNRGIKSENSDYENEGAFNDVTHSA